MNTRNVRAEKLNWIAVQLRGLFPVTGEEEHPRLYRYVSSAYADAYQLAAEIYEIREGKYPKSNKRKNRRKLGRVRKKWRHLEKYRNLRILILQKSERPLYKFKKYDIIIPNILYLLDNT